MSSNNSIDLKGDDHVANSLAGPGVLTFERAVALWVEGNWGTLALHKERDVVQGAACGRIMAVIASAHARLGNVAETQQFIGLAKSNEVDQSFLVDVMSSTAHIMLGRIAAFAGDTEGRNKHYQLAVTTVPFPPLLMGELPGMILAVRDLSASGLKSEAADVMVNHVGDIGGQIDPETDAKIAVLKSEVGLLRHQLMLAQTRGQLDASSADEQDFQESISRMSVSQLGQDLWVLERTGFKKGGFFVEFGATDGISLSNTYLLEREFAWQGILAEPHPGYFKELQSNRECQLVPACIGGRSGDEVEFLLADEFSGMLHHRDRDSNADRRSAYAQFSDNILKLHTISLDEFLEQNGAPKKIDYISVDTEGSELEILMSFPFEKWDVRNWTIEHNFTGDREPIFKLMTSHGYQRREVDWDDWYFR